MILWEYKQDSRKKGAFLSTDEEKVDASSWHNKEIFCSKNDKSLEHSP